MRGARWGNDIQEGVCEGRKVGERQAGTNMWGLCGEEVCLGVG